MQLSLVVPVFNEIAALPELCNEINVLFAKLEITGYECIIVDDGSTDGSRDALARLHDTYPFIKIISQPRSGKSEALKAGWNASAGEWLLCMDGDLQDNCADFSIMIARLEEQHYDMVVGWREHRQDRFKKRIASFFYNTALNVCFGMHLHDHNCGMKILHRDVFHSLALRGTDWHRYLTVLAEQAGYRVGECIVSHRSRAYGNSKYGMGRMVNFTRDLACLLLKR